MERYIDTNAVVEKFKEINDYDGILLAQHMIDNYFYNDSIIHRIIKNLSENKRKYTYKIYDHIIKNYPNENYFNLSDYAVKNDDDVGRFIHLCAINNNLRMMEYLLNEEEIFVDILTTYKETPLKIVCEFYSDNNQRTSNEMIKLLLKYGANVNKFNSKGICILDYLLKNINKIGRTEEFKEAIKLLIEPMENKDIGLIKLCYRRIQSKDTSNEIKDLIKYIKNIDL